ncbi:uncharacterized protein TNCV_503711 [Trichonephila clavipes]|nr:uncharacterized protein TNCV_503711 [Trichonephila clavipes]
MPMFKRLLVGGKVRKGCRSSHLTMVRNYDDRHQKLSGQGHPTSLPPTSREDLRIDGYLKYPRAAKALYIYKHPYLPRDSNPGPTAHQSSSLTTTPDGRQYT